jgi:putative transposase
VSRYVHLNPVRAHLVSLPEHYTWSSMKVYIGEEDIHNIVHKDTVLGWFSHESEPAQKNYRRFVHAKMTEQDSLEGLVTYDDILGTNSFISEIRARYG